ncbi:hypothetical protein EAS54_13105 [Bradyrhizobium guangzhouense]|nr:hypothetical protein EAS54_13105 [Bradyrhizobium guangzhouense]
MHRRHLSSAWTFCAKFVFPALWISGFGMGTILLWLDLMHGKNNELPPPGVIFVGGVWIVGSAFELRAAGCLKRVLIDERELFVSNYFREICIPFSDVIDVRQNCWVRSRPITIYFGDATEFGDRVTFIPKLRSPLQFWCADPDPVVDDLRRLAGLMS